MKFNTKHKLTKTEIKQYSYAILKDIKKVCNELKLTYFLDGGTLLGAIRYSGFIPWDDDIDVSMLRPDYEIFIKEYNKHCIKKYNLKSVTTDSKYSIPYAKIFDTTTIVFEYGRNTLGQGLSVDIFPIDAYPNTYDEQKKYLNKSLDLFNSYAKILSFAYSNYSLNPRLCLRNLKIFAARFFLQRKKAEEIIKNAKIFNFEKSNFLGMVVCLWYYDPEGMWIPKEFWVPIEHQFEDDFFLIPKGYDSILKSYYGDDYIIPPPVEKRISTHGLEVFLK